MSALIVDGDVVHYEVLGRGRPLIFVHGWLGSWRYWVPTLQAVSGEYRAYALDLWGFGDSARRRADYGLDGQVELLRTFMDRLAIIKAAFIGHGLGAAVVALLCRLYPALADRALLVGLPIDTADLNGRLLETPPGSLIETFIERGPHLDLIVRETAKTDHAAVATSVEALRSAEMARLLSELTQPVLLAHGARDTLVSAPGDSVIEALGANVHGVALNESRHFPMLDETARFNRLVSDFLALKDPAELRNLTLKEEWVRRVR